MIFSIPVAILQYNSAQGIDSSRGTGEVPLLHARVRRWNSNTHEGAFQSDISKNCQPKSNHPLRHLFALLSSVTSSLRNNLEEYILPNVFLVHEQTFIVLWIPIKPVKAKIASRKRSPSTALNEIFFTARKLAIATRNMSLSTLNLSRSGWKSVFFPSVRIPPFLCFCISA